jgi:hypothetical protein
VGFEGAVHLGDQLKLSLMAAHLLQRPAVMVRASQRRDS